MNMKLQIEKLNIALKSVHKRFLEHERYQAEEFLNKKLGALEFVMLLTQDKSFEWLQPFSALIAEIDAFVDEEENISKKDLLRIKEQIEKLLNGPTSFLAQRYKQYLNSDAEFIVLHSNLKKELNLFSA